MANTYTTKSGDMWDSIAYQQLGSVNYKDRLMNLNQQYRNYYVFPSGIVLILPEQEQKVNASLPPWKRKEASA